MRNRRGVPEGVSEGGREGGYRRERPYLLPPRERRDRGDGEAPLGELDGGLEHLRK